jgi:hypothetical protein
MSRFWRVLYAKAAFIKNLDWNVTLFGLGLLIAKYPPIKYGGNKLNFSLRTHGHRAQFETCVLRETLLFVVYVKYG